MQKSELKDVPINTVVPYKKNPRFNEKAVKIVAASISAYGYVKTSIGVDEDMILLYGHTTLKALVHLGYTTIPEVTRISGLTPGQKIGYRIDDNKASEYAEWDFDLLYENINLMETNYNMDPVAFKPADLANLRKPHEFALEQPTPQPLTTTIKPGDIIHLGRHKILCGDCTNPTDVNNLYQSEIASLCITSPPYNVGKEGWLPDGTSKYEGDDDDSDKNTYLKLLSDFTTLHLDKSVYLFLNIQMVKGNKIALLEYLNTFRFNLADILIWDKQTAQPAMQENVLNSQFEFIICLKDSPANRKIGTSKFRGTVPNIYSAPPNRENKFAAIHSAAYPIHLPTFLIKNFSNPKDIISDPFLGTGTTLLAAEQLDRTCLGMEMNPIYCEVTCQRWENLTGKPRSLP